MTVSYSKPLPDRNDEVFDAFWAAAQEHRLSLPYCKACNHLFSYPRRFCPECWSDAIAWRELSGRGRIWTFTAVHVPFYDDTWADEVPYLVAIVELDEGPHLLTNIVDAEPEQVAIGDRVEVVFDDVTDDVTLPNFRLRP